MNILPIFAKSFPKKPILLAIIFFVCIPSSSSDDKYKDEPVYGCKGSLMEDNATKTGARGKDWTVIRHDLQNIKLPKSFDARKQWPYCKSIQTILYQGQCGGCWAFSAGSVMSDRLCIATKGKFNKVLSIQDILECCLQCVTEGKVTYFGGCEGGFSEMSFLFWKIRGIVTGGEKGCKPLSKGIPKGIPIKQCRTKCVNSKNSNAYQKDKLFAIDALVKAQYKQKHEKNYLRHIQAEIMLNGPVAAGMDAYDYIDNVKGKKVILKYEESKIREPPTGHAIKLIGWDEIDGVPVWIMANSWGRNWCNEGFCYIRRGYNDFRIERERIISAGLPKLHDEKVTRGAKSTSARFRITVDEYFFNVVLMLNIFLL